MITAGLTPLSCCVDDSTQLVAADRTPDSSNARCPNGTSNEHDTPTGHNQPDHPSPPFENLTERYCT